MNLESNSPGLNDPIPRVKRPRRLTLIGVLLMLHSLAGLYRFGWLIVHWTDNWVLIGPAVLWYEVNTSFMWGLGSLLLSWLLWTGNRITASAAIIWVVLLSAGFWIDRLIVMVNPTNKVGWPFFILINIVLGWMIISSVLSPGSSAYFRRDQHG